MGNYESGEKVPAFLTILEFVDSRCPRVSQHLQIIQIIFLKQLNQMKSCNTRDVGTMIALPTPKEFTAFNRCTQTEI
jgi:hypothetical protein